MMHIVGGVSDDHNGSLKGLLASGRARSVQDGFSLMTNDRPGAARLFLHGSRILPARANRRP